MLTIAIQAGGYSRRMGADKALLPFIGKPMIQRVIERLSPIADEILITTNKPEGYEFLKMPLYTDLIPDRGALGGLLTALSAANHSSVAVIACDMPFINPKMISAELDLMLNSGADIVIPRTSDGLEPFHAIYRRATCLPHVTSAIDKKRWRVDSWFSMVNMQIFTTEEIKKYDPQMYSFMNVNTREELRAAEQLARQMDDAH